MSLVACAALAGVVPVSTGCAALIGALPTITAIVADSIAVLAGIDAIVQEHFRCHPDTSASTRQKYAVLYERTLSALRAVQHAGEGAKKLSDDDVQDAFAAFEKAYGELRDWLFASALMNDAGELMLDGEVLGEVPEASALLQ